MKILFIGVSSFTGFHFVKKISKNKSLKIYCTLTKNFRDYTSEKKVRLNLIRKIKNIKIIENTEFGDKNFIKILKKTYFDILCFHYAHTENYNDDKKFNFKKSLDKNLNNIKDVFLVLNKNQKIIITNTIFQHIKLKRYSAVNNYGKSKTKTYEILKKYCIKKRIKFKSFFITNPWGIFEEKKLNYHLIKNWFKNKIPVVKYPKYIRDNIFINKLSDQYYNLIFSRSKKEEYFPSGYCSTNRVFINALKREFNKYFKKNAKVKFIDNMKHEQPLVRINGKKILKKIYFKENLKKYFDYYKKRLS